MLTTEEQKALHKRIAFINWLGTPALIFDLIWQDDFSAGHYNSSTARCFVIILLLILLGSTGSDSLTWSLVWLYSFLSLRRRYRVEYRLRTQGHVWVTHYEGAPKFERFWILLWKSIPFLKLRSPREHHIKLIVQTPVGILFSLLLMQFHSLLGVFFLICALFMGLRNSLRAELALHLQFLREDAILDTQGFAATRKKHLDPKEIGGVLGNLFPGKNKNASSSSVNTPLATFPPSNYDSPSKSEEFLVPEIIEEEEHSFPPEKSPPLNLNEWEELEIPLLIGSTENDSDTLQITCPDCEALIKVNNVTVGTTTIECPSCNAELHLEFKEEPALTSNDY